MPLLTWTNCTLSWIEFVSRTGSMWMPAALQAMSISTRLPEFLSGRAIG